MAQPADSVINALQEIPGNFYAKAAKKYADIDKKLSRKTLSYLKRLQRQENKLNKKLSALDSTARTGNALAINARYDEIKGMLNKLPWMQLGQDIIDENPKGAIQTIMEIGISKTPAGGYYYSFKVLKFAFMNDNVIGEAGKDALNKSKRFYNEGVRYQRAGNNAQAKIKFDEAIRYEKIAKSAVHMLQEN